VDAVKIGMLHSPEIVRVVAAAIRAHGLTQVVFDPVMVATSGDRLIAEETVQVLKDELFPLVRLITPNLDEAELLLGRKITGLPDLDAAAAELLALGAPAVLLKGGHLAQRGGGNEVVDVLLAQDARLRLASERIESHNVHGTGCTLSSAIAAHLALGHALPQAVELARAYILQAIASGAGVRTGQGHGPLNHGFAPVAMVKR
jgi:hydroxymethylpyrimidine/phosphomethylpyrimidine kinase